MRPLGHYLRPGVRPSAPGVLFSVVVSEAVHSQGSNEYEQFRTWNGADVCCSHWRRGRWLPSRAARCETTRELYDWMRANADPKRKNWVVTPSGNGALAQCDVWEQIASGPVLWAPPSVAVTANKLKPFKQKGTVIRGLCLNPSATILDYTRAGIRWVWVGTGQYFKAPENDMAQAFGFDWPVTGFLDDERGRCSRVPAERCALWLKVFQELAAWWRENAKTAMGLTASSMAMGMLRSHITPRTLRTHMRPEAHILERSACFGARCSTFYYGDVGEPLRHDTDAAPAPRASKYGSLDAPLYQWDISSMYPSLLRDELFPMHFTECRKVVKPWEPQTWATAQGVIADVTIETDVAEYPYRERTHIIYPTGRFRTVLCGPELLKLRDEGRVVACHLCCFYTLGRPFQRAASAMIETREQAKRDNRPAWELFAKTMANGIGGKLAQKTGAWLDKPREVAPGICQFGTWYDRKRGKSVMKRAIAGCVQEYVRDHTGRGPFTFAHAYLACYGRLMLRKWREVCPARSVVSVDTDGVWVTEDGHAALLDATRDQKPGAGAMRFVNQVEAARFLDPRHYWTPGEWVLSGFADPVVSARGTMVLSTRTHTALAGPAGAPPKGVSVSRTCKSLSIQARGVTIGADGWTVPRRRTMAVEE